VSPSRQPIALFVALALAAGGLLLAACGPTDPVERIAEARAGYGADLTGFYAKQVEIVPASEDPLLGEGATGDEAATEDEVAEEPIGEESGVDEEGAGEGEVEVLVEVPTRTDLVLDVIVSRVGSTELPGLTLDITLVDSDQAEKGHWLWWVETAGMPKGDQRQFSHVLEDVDYADGDGLLVEVREPVPPAERGDYREFRAGGAG
jgi:hypothetical protein